MIRLAYTIFRETKTTKRQKLNLPSGLNRTSSLDSHYSTHRVFDIWVIVFVSKGNAQVVVVHGSIKINI